VISREETVGASHIGHAEGTDVLPARCQPDSGPVLRPEEVHTWRRVNRSRASCAKWPVAVTPEHCAGRISLACMNRSSAEATCLVNAFGDWGATCGAGPVSWRTGWLPDDLGSVGETGARDPVTFGQDGTI
jgi:hypothetical protein